jgi:hypothetical protein
MGNVHAYSAPAPPPPTPSASPYTKTETTTKGPSQEVENPGPLEEIHTKCKSKLRTKHNLEFSYLAFRYIPYKFRRSKSDAYERS